MAGQENDRQGPQAAAEHEPVSRAVSKQGAVPAEKRKGLYTMNAQEALDASELVNAAFGRKTLGTRTPRRLEVIAPDGPSTAGGKHARQTIRLVPASGDSGPVMLGFLDVAQKLVELRSYETVAQQYEARFGQGFDITAEEHATITRELQMVLTPFRYTFQQDAERPVAPAKTTSIRVEPKSSQRFNMIVMAVFMVIAAAVALTMMR